MKIINNFKNIEDIDKSKISIRVRNKKEYNDARKKLEDLGFTWASGHLPTELGNDYYRPEIHIGVDVYRKTIVNGPFMNSEIQFYKNLVTENIKTIY